MSLESSVSVSIFCLRKSHLNIKNARIYTYIQYKEMLPYNSMHPYLLYVPQTILHTSLSENVLADYSQSEISK